MAKKTENFFEKKKEWSKVKYDILSNYLPAYLKKVNYLRKKIIIVDAFAGTGKFEDGGDGSPIVICNIAEQFITNNYLAIFVNKEREHYNLLEIYLKDLIEKKKVINVHGDAKALLANLNNVLSTQTLFLYLDPFGLKGCEFNIIKPYLERAKSYSTEVLIRFDAQTIFRLSCSTQESKSEDRKYIEGKQHSLTDILGGEYWKDILFSESLQPNEKIERVIKKYCELLRKYLPVVCFCPVPESHNDKKIKYYLVFASRHIDAAVLMNDIMYQAYYGFINKSRNEGTLFEEVDWRQELMEKRNEELKILILSIIKKEKLSRIDLWHKIILSNFMQFHSKQYRDVIKDFIKNNRLNFEDVKGTGKLNDQSIIFIK